MSGGLAKSMSLLMLLTHLSLVPLSVGPAVGAQKASAKTEDNSSVAAIQKMKSAVVQISYSAEVSARMAHGVAGTGFLITKGPYVITSNHVIMKMVEELNRLRATNVKLTVGLPIPDQVSARVVIRGSFRGVGFDVVDADPLHDIVLLKLTEDPFKGEVRPMIAKQELPLRVTVARLGPESPPEGTTLLVSGYPLARISHRKIEKGCRFLA